MTNIQTLHTSYISSQTMFRTTFLFSFILLFTHMSKCLKKFVKLKSWSVGWVLMVRFGNVEKKAWASNDATNPRSSSTLSAVKHFLVKQLYGVPLKNISILEIAGIVYWDVMSCSCYENFRSSINIQDSTNSNIW